MNYSEFYTDKVAYTVDNEVENFNYACDTCILPEGYIFGEYLQEDEKQECKFCRGFKKPNFLGEKSFIKDVDLRENERIGVTISGGKDSLFAWHYLVKCFGREKIVAFNHKKKGLVHPLATENIFRANEVLGTHLITLEDNKMLARFKKNFEALLNNPSPEMVRVALCAGCRFGITEKLYSKGADLGITKYVSAASYLELAPFKEEYLEQKGQGDDKRGLLKGINENGKYNFADNLDYILRDHEYKYKGNISCNSEAKTRFGDFELFDLDTYIESDPETVEKFVIKNLNWIRPERSWHFDCVIEEMKDVFYYGLLGYTESDFKLSAMVRHNLMTREEAIKQIQIVGTITRNSFPKTAEFMTKMGLGHLVDKMQDFYTASPYLATPSTRKLEKTI